MANSVLIADLEKQFRENPRRVFARLANEYRKAGDYQRAIEICRTHVPHQPGYISGHIVLGQALFESGQLGDAQKAFETALGLDPENLIALRHLGDIAREHGEISPARGWYQKLLEVDPQNDEVAALLSAMESQHGTGADAQTASASPASADLATTAAQIDPLRIEPIESVPPVKAAESKAAGAAADTERLEIEMDDRFTPNPAVARSVDIPDLEQSVEITADSFAPAPTADQPSATVEGVTPPSSTTAPPPSETPDESRAAVQSLFGDAVLHEEPKRAKPVPPSTEPRDAVDAYYPMLVPAQPASAPSAFVTETMAELYLQQGYTQEALDIYRQLAAQNPNDTTIRERVAQLERGARSSIGSVAISDEVVAAAQKRHTAKPTRTIRSFFGRLAGRRVRGAWPPNGMTGSGDEGSNGELPAAERESEGPPEWTAASAPTGVEDFDLLSPAETRAASAGPVTSPPAREESPSASSDAWDARPDETASGAIPSDAWFDPAAEEPAAPSARPRDVAADARGRAATSRPATSDDRDEVSEPSWLTSDGPRVRETPDEEEAALAGLFGQEAIDPADDEAARRLASAFGSGDAQSGRPSDGDVARPGNRELSLDEVFKATPTRQDAPRPGFSYDQFFENRAGGAAEGEAERQAEPSRNDLELFNAWLEGLKK